MLVRDWMTKDPLIIEEDATMMKALSLMKQHRFRRFPVLNDGNLVGIITDRNLRAALPSGVTTFDIHEAHYLLKELRVGDIMTCNPITISQKDKMKYAAKLMLDYTISGLLVINEEEQLVGILTQADISRSFMHISNFILHDSMITGKNYNSC